MIGFLLFSKPSADKSVLLNGHTTHVENIDLIIKARENNVYLLCFPPHTTHRLQPHDKSLMFPLSTHLYLLFRGSVKITCKS